MVKSQYFEKDEDNYQNDMGQLLNNNRNLAFDAEKYFNYLWDKYTEEETI